MAEYTLHAFAQSGNCYKVALALELAGADWSARFVDFFNGQTRTPAYRELNVMGEAPVLEHRGLRLSQSGVILDYLTGTLGRFGGDSDDERREILRWILFDNHKLTSYTATYRFLRVLAKDPNPHVQDEFRRRSEAAWRVLDTHLAGRAYVVGERLTIADLSLAGYLFFDDEIGVVWNDAHPNVAAWLARIRGESRWKHPYQLLPGHPRPASS